MKALILAAAALVAVIGSARAESGIASHYSTREQAKDCQWSPLHDGALTAAHGHCHSAAACALPIMRMGAVSSLRLPTEDLMCAVG